MGKFYEAKESLRGKVKHGKNGNVIYSFSKTDFNDMVNALLNDGEHSMETIKLIDGTATEVSTPVVQEFRENFLVPILMKAGMDKNDAQQLAQTWHFNSSSTKNMYDLVSEMLYQYLDADKKFNFPNRKNFAGSIHLKEVKEATVTRTLRDIKDHKTITGTKTEKQETHKTLVKKSTCPAWLRHVL